MSVFGEKDRPVEWRADLAAVGVSRDLENDARIFVGGEGIGLVPAEDDGFAGRDFVQGKGRSGRPPQKLSIPTTPK